MVDPTSTTHDRSADKSVDYQRGFEAGLAAGLAKEEESYNKGYGNAIRDMLEHGHLLAANRGVTVARHNPMDLDLGALGLSTRLINTLRREGLTNVGDVYSDKYRRELPEFRGLGAGSYAELNDKLTARGYPALPKAVF